MGNCISNNDKKIQKIRQTPATIRFSQNLAPRLHSGLLKVIGDLTKVTDYHYIHDKLSLINTTYKTRKSELDHFVRLDNPIHIATVYCDTQVMIYVCQGNMVGDEQYYLVIE